MCNKAYWTPFSFEVDTKHTENNCSGGRGGNGGGAIKIFAETSITVTGALSVNGESGQGDIQNSGRLDIFYNLCSM